MNALKHGLSSKELIDELEKKLYDSHLEKLSKKYDHLWAFVAPLAEMLSFYSAKMYKASLIEERYEALNALNKAKNNEVFLREQLEIFDDPEDVEMFERIVTKYDYILDITDIDDVMAIRRYTRDIENSYYKALNYFMKVVEFEKKMRSFCKTVT